MAGKFTENKNWNLTAIDQEILGFWKKNEIFKKSLSVHAEGKPFVFYEGPPSANGLPGIHHVMARTIKDLFCRYKTMQGYNVSRKGGWDTHGLPIELSVEKTLGITKEDIGTKITIEEYNATCKTEVMKYKDVWDDLTEKMAYWVDLEDPYVTFHNNYIETVWYLLKQLYDKGFLYKGFTIQPFSPAAGTGLSTHELNQPGTYKDVKDTSATAQFKIFDRENEYFLAWTTTPWTLPSNTALAVGKKITYVKIKTLNPYTQVHIIVYLAKDLMRKYFNAEDEGKDAEDFKLNKVLPYTVIEEVSGSDLIGLRYEQLLPYQQPEEGDAFRVIEADYVTTEDGTGIVHIAPSFGADDKRVAEINGIGNLTLVDRQGKFIDGVGEFSGRYVKDYKDDPDYVSVDIDISVKLKLENKAFKIEKYEHNYPHCWRTDKPIIYYPMNSWFVKVTAVKDRLVALNKTINWKPKSTGEGRFGNWLENLQDWNLSRSRFWGTPIPIWRTEDGEEEICIGSVKELQQEVEKAMQAGFMDQPLADDFDLHKPYVDRIFLVAPSGKKMYREPDLIDVWFDSGAMPYAQWHYPFENVAQFKANFPADFIAEGVDQTRGWFYTLHALGVMLFDSVAYKNVISNGLLQDKSGRKMSKRLGNAADPFETLNQFGIDATRWYIISNSQPWDNLKFDQDGIAEVKRKFFGTLLNTYSFFALYGNIDNFQTSLPAVDYNDRSELDRWIISRLNSLIENAIDAYDDYEPTKASRFVMEFVEELSNWFIRLSRKRFWNSVSIDDHTVAAKDKLSSYQTLYECLVKVISLMAPISPIITEKLYHSLLQTTNSIHLERMPVANEHLIDNELEQRMILAQKISSMVLSLRKKEKIKVRQPLQKILIPVLDHKFQQRLELVEHLIKSEVNVKEIEYLGEESGLIVKTIKPNFALLGKRLGAKMKFVHQALQSFSQEQIQQIERENQIEINLGDTIETLFLEEVNIESKDIPGWIVNSSDGVTVALDISISNELKLEGLAREIVNKVQNLRKDKDFEVTDEIVMQIEENKNHDIQETVKVHKKYICNETLTKELALVNNIDGAKDVIDINKTDVLISIQKQ